MDINLIKRVGIAAAYKGGGVLKANFGKIPTIRIFNKQDLIDKNETQRLCRYFDAIPVSAKNESTLSELIKKMEQSIQPVFIAQQKSLKNYSISP